MPFSGHEITTWYQEETTFGEPPADWDATGIPFFCVEPSVEGLQRAMLENPSYRQHALETYPLIKSLKNASGPTFGILLRGSGVVTPEDEFAESFPLADMLHNAWGGLRLGYATGLAGGTAAAPEVDTGEGSNIDPGDWGFYVDATTGRGEFRPNDVVATDTLTPRWPLSFTPDGGGADSMGAVICAFPNRAALTNFADADAITHSFFFQHAHADDTWEMTGVKLNLTAIEGITPGEAPMARFEGMSLTWTQDVAQNDADVDPEGAAPLSTATGVSTTVYIGNLAATPDAIIPNSYVATPGIASQAVPGLGPHGRQGYNLAQSSADAPTLELSLPYDAQWLTDFEADQRKHVLLQIGDERGQAVGLYFQHCQIAADPSRTVSTDMSTMRILLRPLMGNVASAATGAQLELHRAKILILMAA